MECRELITDVPQALGVPTMSATVVTPGSGFMSAGTYYVQVTAFTAWGESAPSVESAQLTLVSNRSIQIAITSPIAPIVTKYRAYVTLVNGASGTEQFYAER